jgi:hypothetical protein
MEITYFEKMFNNISKFKIEDYQNNINLISNELKGIIEDIRLNVEKR